MVANTSASQAHFSHGTFETKQIQIYFYWWLDSGKLNLLLSKSFTRNTDHASTTLHFILIRSLIRNRKSRKRQCKTLSISI